MDNENFEIVVRLHTSDAVLEVGTDPDTGSLVEIRTPDAREQRTVDVGALLELVANWRSMRREYDGSAGDALCNCADELESLIKVGGFNNDH